MIEFKHFSENGSKPQTQEVFDRRWWLSNKTDRAGAIFSALNTLSKFDQQRQTQYQKSAKLYGNFSLYGLNGLNFANQSQSGTPNAQDRVTYNVIQSTIDTITSKIAKNKPDPLFLTSGGDYKIQRRAKKLDQFVDGIFYENDAYHLGNTIFRDACVFGDGFVHVFPHYGRVKMERVLPSEIYVDWMESFYGEPRQMHRVKNVDRQVLMDLYPSKANAIKEAMASRPNEQSNSASTISDQVTIVESWHLASGPDQNDGMHCISIADRVLFEEKYTHDFFPFAHFSWSKRLFGFFGQGLSEQIQSIQLEMNKILYIIQRSMHLAGSFKVLLENGSKIVKEHLNNDIGAIIQYANNPPQYVTPPIVPMELYTHLQTLKNSAFEVAGISQLSAVSQKPAGLNSGAALREYNDIESDRFMIVGQNYERFFLKLAKLCIAVGQEIYQEKKKLEVKVPGTKFIDTISWKEIDLTEDAYVMKCFPISSLPQEPSGRLSTIQEYLQAGFLTPRQGRRLLDFPDLEAVEGLQNASEDYLHQVLEKMVEEEPEYTAPEPYDDLGLARELAMEYYAQGKRDNLEEEKLELLRRFMDQIDLYQQAMAQPQGAGQPQAVPQAPQTSDMIQNTPQA